MGDVLGSIAVILSVLVIKYGENTLGQWRFLADPLCSIVIVVLLTYSTIPVIKESVDILLIKVPPTIDLAKLKSRMMLVSGVVDVHCIHIWTMNDTTAVGYLHLVVASTADQLKATRKIKRILHRGGVHSTTIQVEVAPVGMTAITARMICVGDEVCHDPKCTEKKCCIITNLDTLIKEKKSH